LSSGANKDSENMTKTDSSLIIAAGFIISAAGMVGDFTYRMILIAIAVAVGLILLYRSLKRQ
jgi:hypothetical protein